MLHSRLTCLCPTHGRLTRLRESLACFLQQDCREAVLVIYNFHDRPLRLAGHYRNVRLVNEPHPGDVHQVWRRALELVETEYIHPWYDDDLYLPWAASQGLDCIGHADAFKPRLFYQMTGISHPDTGARDVHTTENVGEGSMTIRTDHARAIGLTDADGLIPPRLTVLNVSPSWVFRWGDGICKSEGISRELDRTQHNVHWRARNQDTGTGVLLPLDVAAYWRLIVSRFPAVAGRLDHYITGPGRRPWLDQAVAADTGVGLPTLREGWRDLTTLPGDAGREDVHGGWQAFVGRKFSRLSILDVGSGLGNSKLPDRLAQNGNVVTSQDVAPYLDIDLGTDVAKIPPKSYDVVTAFDVLQHVPAPAPFVAHLARIARIGVFLTTPNWYDGRGGAVYHCCEYTPAQFLYLLHGYTVVELYGGDPAGILPTRLDHSGFAAHRHPAQAAFFTEGKI